MVVYPRKRKILEILVLRQQLAILQRKWDKPVKPNRAVKLTLAILAAKLKQATQRPTNQLQDFIRIFQPETVIRWHQELVRRKWTYQGKHKGGRPRIGKELDDLILRLAQEDPRLGYGKIEGEFIKLNFKVSQTTIRNGLDRQGILPAVVRRGSIGWLHLMGHYKEQIQACDFFTVEIIWLKTVYMLFFIELGTRRVQLAGCTTNPDTTWVTQQARQRVWYLKDDAQDRAFLIHDNDKKLTSSFDIVFSSEGIEIVHTPSIAK